MSATEARHGSARRRWNVRVLVAAVCAGLLVGGVVWLWARGSAATAGPMHPAPNTTLNGIRLAAPGEITWGDVLVRNTTDQSVVLKTVRLGGGIRGTAEALRVTRAEAVDPRRTGQGIGMTQGQGHDVIPAALRSPLAGYVIEPGHDAEVLLRLAVGKTGAWRVPLNGRGTTPLPETSPLASFHGTSGPRTYERGARPWRG